MHQIQAFEVQNCKNFRGTAPDFQIFSSNHHVVSCSTKQPVTGYHVDIHTIPANVYSFLTFCLALSDANVVRALVSMTCQDSEDMVWPHTANFGQMYSPMLSDLAHSGIQSLHSVHRLSGEEWDR